MIAGGGVAADGARSLRNDPIARLSAWIWLTVPRRAAARLPFLRDVAGDGHFLTVVPVVAVFLPIACLASGFWVGAHHWGYTFAATESVFLLSALVALGAFATQLGLLALVGFALGDFFVRFTTWSYTVVDLGGPIDLSPGATSDPVRRGGGLLDDGVVAGLWRVRIPLLIMYLVLGTGAVLVPRLARGVAGIALRSARVPPNLDWLVASFAYVVTVWLALSGWATSVPLLIRPYFTWKGGLAGGLPPAQATVPIQHFRKEIVAAAVIAAIVRQLVVLAIDRNRRAAARVDIVVSLAQPIRPPRPATRRRALLRAVAAALVATLMVSGTLERVWTWALAAAVFLAIALLRSELLPSRMLTAWRRLAERLPLLVRLVVILVAVRVVAGFLAGSVIASYESLAVFVILGALVSVLLLPPPELPPAEQEDDQEDGLALDHRPAEVLA
jgi:hypothetical protein